MLVNKEVNENQDINIIVKNVRIPHVATQTSIGDIKVWHIN